MSDVLEQRAPSTDDQPMPEDTAVLSAPEGASFNPDPNKWYYLEAQYLRDGKITKGRLAPVGSNPTRAFWDYIEISHYQSGGCQLKFTQLPGQPWYSVEVKEDGYKLCMKATGWMYRASHYSAGFLIAEGRLFVDSWSGPLGCANSYKLDSETYYVGASLDNLLENCELIEA